MAKVIQKYTPLCLLAVLILLIGIGIARKTDRAIAPPIYDAIEYYMKAGNFWDALKAHRLGNPLNIQPTLRPPGTILVTYPFGFSADFRWSLFRVTYIPIIIFLTAFWLLAESLVVKWQDRWLNFGAAAALASLPLFYQFEYNPEFFSPVWWGLMDTFVASISAMAVALLLVSVRSKKIGVAFCGSVLAAFTLMVKPAGLFFIPLILWHWVIELLITYGPVRESWRKDGQFRRYIARVTAFLGLAIGAVVAISFKSAYISRENVQFASDAMKIMRLGSSMQIVSQILRGIHSSVGWHWFALFLVVAIIMTGRFIFRMISHRLTGNDVRFFGAFAALCGGVAWWILLPGILHRYMFPFILVFAVVATPQLAAGLQRLPWQTRLITLIAATCPLLFTMVLLFADHPPVALQRLAGVNLSTGQYHAEVELGNLVFDDAEKRQTHLKVYSTRFDPVTGVVQATGIYRSYKNPASKGFDLLQSLDWRSGPLIRSGDFVTSDYILFYPARDAARMQAISAQTDIPGFAEEQELIEAWLTDASAREGVEPMGGDIMKLLRIIDRPKFEEAYDNLVAKHHWPADFLASDRERKKIATQSLRVDHGP